MTALLEGLKALGAARLIAMGVVAMGLLGLLGMLALRGGSDRMALTGGRQRSVQHSGSPLSSRGDWVSSVVRGVPRARAGL